MSERMKLEAANLRALAARIERHRGNLDAEAIDETIRAMMAQADRLEGSVGYKCDNPRCATNTHRVIDSTCRGCRDEMKRRGTA